MSTLRQTKGGRFLAKAAPAIVAVLAVASVTGSPASAGTPSRGGDLPISTPLRPQRWWCWDQQCVEISAAGCAALGGEHWDYQLFGGWIGGCELP